MVKLTEDAPCMVIEGDEYLTSPIDPRPKFHLYKPDIALISGIAWDHINVFPTIENYIEQFAEFIRQVTPGGTLIFFEKDEELRKIALETRDDIEILPYNTPEYMVTDGNTIVRYGSASYPVMVFGKHNLQNLEGARYVCRQLGVTNEQFYTAISSFRGASRRLELISGGGTTKVYKDFAHAPSKLKATINAVKEQYPVQHLVACMELHTFSSLSSGFLSHYKDSMNQADTAIVYFSPHALEMKRLPAITATEVREGFGRKDLLVFTDLSALSGYLLDQPWADKVLLMMSSGNFDGLDLAGLAGTITGK
jgi:UDP-N-acetylmuramate: L-alanyl-gamma-D-glutamyl-meso-diaminopimelate ligase